ncbi:nucleoside triphosphate hydrolase protein, partial [Wolfiporia cocos MD-104 SS10]
VGSSGWLSALLQRKCQISRPREFQVRHGMDLINGKDLFLVIAPGQGKTIVMFAPLLAAQARAEAGIAFIIVPTKLLTLQLSNGASKAGLRAIAINEDTLRTAQLDQRDLFKEIAAGDDVRVAVMSPQMFSGIRMHAFLRIAENRRNVRWLMVDEAHLVDEESTVWYQPYRSIQTMRARLGSNTIWAAVTGTATPARAASITSALGFRQGCYVNARYSVDRPNVKYIPRFFSHSVSGTDFLDIAFLIPHNMTKAQDIAITLVFCNTIETGYRVMKFLDRLIPAELPNRLGMVKLYNSLMPESYRKKFIGDINANSDLRIGVCTDTLVYGCDIPGVRRTVNMGIPKSRQEAKQKDLRGGRDGSPALAYSFAPEWVREVPSKMICTKQDQVNAERRRKLDPGVLRWFGPGPAMCPRQLDLESNGEDFQPHDPCCSVCQPQPERLLDAAANAKWAKKLAQLAPEKSTVTVRSDGTYPTLGLRTRRAFITMLLKWRASAWAQVSNKHPDEPHEWLLPTFLVDRLADKAHVCTTFEKFKQVMAGWRYMPTHGERLFRWLSEVLAGFDD